ncbi:uncharacterized protein MKK02DRAFT_39787 [Dioszegia hungarica]|uniref:Uncharacterized protein n=1 Tax=Dioszegia hungarica TaxID=4972 RepID=A0AA38HFU5_9TREE|nr:uncharacterized protein MKK02DRAFT_39787 [Dioszegia hungarica]KAI9639487.1 hypothetical protein MKK02DRAFT_39787 [Dioszegia hungarica]
MPASDGLQPILTPGEKAVVKDYGGWTNFSLSYGLKPWESADNAEAHQIAKGMASNDQADAKAKGTSK